MCRERVVINKTKSPEKALSSLMRLCARAEKSSGDAMRLMARWGVEPAQREQILQRLITEKFIDDRRFATAYVREKINLSGWGERKIAMNLKTKGVAGDIILELLGDLDREGMQERLSSKLERKMRVVKYKDKYDLKRKVIAYGLSLGFSYDMVLDAMSKLTIEEDDE